MNMMIVTIQMAILPLVGIKEEPMIVVDDGFQICQQHHDRIVIEMEVRSCMILTWLLMATMFSGCGLSESRNKQSTDEWEAKEFERDVSLEVNDSIVLGDLFKSPEWKLCENALCVLDPFRTTELVRLYDIRTGMLVDSAFVMGNGPGEYITINDGEAKRPDNLLLYDIMGKTLNIVDFNLESGINVVDSYPLFTDSEGRTYPYTYISQVSDSIFLLKSDDVDDTSWHIADIKEGKILKKERNKTRPDGEGYPPYYFMQTIAGDNTLGVAYKYINRMEIYRIENSGLHLLQAYGSPDYIQPEDSEDRKIHALSLTDDDTDFYLLVSDGSDIESNIVECYHAKSGEVGNRYILDRKISAIGFNSEGCLVGISMEEDCTKFYIWKLGS